jgi:hypothetical protein
MGRFGESATRYGWATETFTADRYRPADYPGWRSKMLAAVMEAMYYAPAKTEFCSGDWPALRKTVYVPSFVRGFPCTRD